MVLELESQPGNNCKYRLPRWASRNLGIFISKIGTHITRVKSLKMDDWTKEEVETMKSIGNVNSNKIYNPNEICNPPPPPNLEETERDSEIEQCIQEKYEYRKFFDKSALVAPKLGPPRPSSLAQVLPASLPQPVPVPRSNAHTTKSHIAASTASTSSYTAPAAPPKHPQLLPTAQPPHPSGGVWNDMNPIKGNSQHLSLPLQYQQDTEKDFASEAYIPATWPSPHLPVRRETMIRKRKSKSMVHGKEITISGGKLTNVEGDYHEHNTTYVIEEAPTYRGCLETLKDRVKNLETKVNKLLISSPKEDITKSDDSNRQTMHSPLQKKNESMGDTSSSSHVTEIQFNSLNDPPRSTSVFDDGYCIYQTPSPSRTNDSTPNSRNFSAMAQNGRSLPLGNQLPYPFGYSPVMVPGIAHFFPCW